MVEEAAINLHRFRAISPHRKFGGVNHVMHINGMAYATDGRIIVAVPCADPDNATPHRDGGYSVGDSGRFPDPARILPPDAIVASDEGWTLWPPIERELGEECGACYGSSVLADRRFAACTRCDGSGTYVCPTCDHEEDDCTGCLGTGYSEVGPCPFCAGVPPGPFSPTRQKVGNVFVALVYDNLVRSLPGVRYRPAKAEPHAVLWLKFDGGCGCVVPMADEG